MGTRWNGTETYKFLSIFRRRDDLACLECVGNTGESCGLPALLPFLSHDCRSFELVVVFEFHLLLLLGLLATFLVAVLSNLLARPGLLQGTLDFLCVLDRFVPLLLAQLFESVAEHDFVHVAQLCFRFPNDEFFQQAFPVVDVDGFATRELALHLRLKLDELIERFAREETSDLGLDSLVRPRLCGVCRDPHLAFLAESFEGGRRDDQERAPELLVRLYFLEREIHFDVFVKFFRVLEREMLSTAE